MTEQEIIQSLVLFLVVGTPIVMLSDLHGGILGWINRRREPADPPSFTDLHRQSLAEWDAQYKERFGLSSYEKELLMHAVGERAWPIPSSAEWNTSGLTQQRILMNQFVSPTNASSPAFNAWRPVPTIPMAYGASSKTPGNIVTEILLRTGVCVPRTMVTGQRNMLDLNQQAELRRFDLQMANLNIEQRRQVMNEITTYLGERSQQNALIQMTGEVTPMRPSNE